MSREFEYMRVLAVSALFPPHVIGGAEMSAYNLAQWLASRGHEVGVLTAASSREDEVFGRMENGLKVWRRYMPRIYPISTFPSQPAWKKPIWHIQDHIHPRNRKIMADTLDEFRPDLVNIHYIQGIGYNALSEIGKRGIATNFALHDIGLACIRMNMFKNGRECKKQCLSCAVSTEYKKSQLEKIENLAFVSPSVANLQAVQKFIPRAREKARSILNANAYPKPNNLVRDGQAFRFLYVGRVHPSKGIDVLLKAADQLSAKYDFEVLVVGGGDAPELIREYEGKSWCRFIGHVSQNDVADYMAQSDVLCVPSVWLENSPGVVIHALQLSLPVLGSNKGGIPELVKDGLNGALVEAGDVAAWASAMERALADARYLEELRRGASAGAERFSQDSIGEEYLEFFRSSLNVSE